MFSSSSTEYTLWQTDSMKTFSPSQHVARRSVIASSSCRSGVSWSYKRRERMMGLVTKMFSSPSTHHPHSHLSEQVPSLLFCPFSKQMVTKFLPCLAEELYDEGLVALHRKVNFLNLTHIGKRKKIALMLLIVGQITMNHFTLSSYH